MSNSFLKSRFRTKQRKFLSFRYLGEKVLFPIGENDGIAINRPKCNRAFERLAIDYLYLLDKKLYKDGIESILKEWFSSDDIYHAIAFLQYYPIDITRRWLTYRRHILRKPLFIRILTCIKRKFLL